MRVGVPTKATATTLSTLNNMELNEKDKELIAKIDERLKHYNLITDNKQPITEQKERWKPAPLEIYYYINDRIKIAASTDDNHPFDNKRIEAGNCFPTEEAATKAAQAIRETLKNL